MFAPNINGQASRKLISNTYWKYGNSFIQNEPPTYNISQVTPKQTSKF